MKKQHTYLWLADQIKAEWLLNLEALPGTRLPTERQLQEQFGVSRATVSKAIALLANEGLILSRPGSGNYIAHPPTVPEPTRLIGYISQSYLPKPNTRQSSLTLHVYHGVECRAQELGYKVLTSSANFSLEQEEALVEQFVRIGVEGIIIYPVDSPGMRRLSDASSDHLARRWLETPIVLVDNGVEAWGRPIVQFDNYRLGYEMTEELIKRGHRRIAYMHTSPERLHNSVHDRQRGWTAALRRAGLNVPASYQGWPWKLFDFNHNFTKEDMERLVQDLLALDPRPDAVIAWEDNTAMQLTQTLQEQSVHVPQEVRVAAFDNLEMGRFFRPQFPTSDPDFMRMGEVATDILDRMIGGERIGAYSYVLPVSVLWREPSHDRIPVRWREPSPVPSAVAPAPRGGDRVVSS